MADDPNKPELQEFSILVIVPEYRTYTVRGDGQDDARVAFLTKPGDFNYEVGDDAGEPEIIDLWEA
jgi:hypothetical protein